MSDYKFQTFLDKIRIKINNQKQPYHKYVLVSSGTAFQITKEVIKDLPGDQKTNAYKSMNQNWIAGKNTLEGLTALIRDHVATYDGMDLNRILKEIPFDFTDIFVKWAMLEPQFHNDVKEKFPNLKIINAKECLKID